MSDQMDPLSIHRELCSRSPQSERADSRHHRRRCCKNRNRHRWRSKSGRRQYQSCRPGSSTETLALPPAGGTACRLHGWHRGAGVAVQQNHEGHWRLAVVAGGDVNVHWPGAGDAVKRGRERRLNGERIGRSRERLPRPRRAVRPLQLAASAPSEEVDVPLALDGQRGVKRQAPPCEKFQSGSRSECLRWWTRSPAWRRRSDCSGSL